MYLLLLQLEEQLQQLEKTKADLMTSQYEQHEAQEQWSVERNHMLTELEETKRQYTEEKGRIVDIIAEVSTRRRRDTSSISSQRSVHGGERTHASM